MGNYILVNTTDMDEYINKGKPLVYSSFARITPNDQLFMTTYQAPENGGLIACHVWVCNSKDFTDKVRQTLLQGKPQRLESDIYINEKSGSIETSVFRVNSEILSLLVEDEKKYDLLSYSDYYKLQIGEK